ncbi:DUF1064 domain-containing protein [Sphingopyxis sp. 113P3]|uniref:DUF1064 domain-containing protein n=1 Tax=Sphingopyxis sp. (strain 113P3) TaxID=292913 RepID=UPI0006BC5611|nr:DUF1064 domain-containing protein [Sphingopyxis sp. 113P3]ALC11239.1 hypothetical protein LH20_04660 [Sphingopyxis sp. 113P3]
MIALKPSMRMRALGRLKQGERNKTEIAYEDDVLKPAMQAGEVLWYAFEPWKIRIGKNCFYTPDYAVLSRNGQLECHEVKGHPRIFMDDAKVKVRAASAVMPFRFLVAFPIPKNEGGGWRTVEY